MDHISNSTYISAGAQAAAAIRGLCFVLGLSGNITVVIFLLRHFKRDNFILKLMLNLASSDILSLLTLPVWMYSILHGWTMSLDFCKFVHFICYTGIQASVLTVTLMSVQRYVLVFYRPQWSKLGQRGERAVLTGLWVLAGLPSISTVISVDIFEDEGKLTCEQVFRSEGEKVAVLLPEILFFYFTPLTTLTTSYLCLYKKVNDKALTNYRLAPLTTAIIVTFFLCTTPYAVVCVMMIATPLQVLGSVKGLAYRGPKRAMESIVFLNSCVNPLLYAFNFRSLRQSAEKNVADISSHVKHNAQSIATIA